MPAPRRLARDRSTIRPTHAFPIPAGHPLAGTYRPGSILLLADHKPGAALEPGRYLDDAGNVRRCVAGPCGAPYLAGDGLPACAGYEATVVARIVGVQINEDAPAPAFGAR